MEELLDKRRGWKKDTFDKRDYLFRAKPWVALPNSVPENAAYLPAIRDQGNVGSCVGFGIGANLVARDKLLARYLDWYSPTWIYNGARYIEGTLMFDLGCYPRDALHWLYMKGCLLEYLWPYDPEKLDTTPPPSSLEPEAAKHPLLSYYRVVDGVEGICSCLADHHFVSIGTPWPDKWMHREPFNGDLEEITVSDLSNAGHETCLYDYDLELERVFGINSWSEEWGNKGLFSMPFSAFDVFKQAGGYDAHYIGLTAAEEEPENGDSSPCKVARAMVWLLNKAAERWGSNTRIPAPVKLKVSRAVLPEAATMTSCRSYLLLEDARE
jgi:hypothetical protein